MTQDNIVVNKTIPNNLVLTEKAIKNHSKRLQKEVKTLDREISLCEAQNLFSRTLGFNNFHEVKAVLKNREGKLSGINTIYDFYRFIESIETKSDFIWLLPNGKIEYKPHDKDLDDSNFITTSHYGFTLQDFQNVNNIISDRSDLVKFQELKDDDHILITFPIDINEKLMRNIIVQVYKEKSKISAIKILMNYRSIENGRLGSCKRYPELKHLF